LTYETRYSSEQLELLVEIIEWRIGILSDQHQVDARLWAVLRTTKAAHEAQCVYENELDSRRASSPFGPVRSFRLYRG
jgi:hypothetical protein